MMWPFIFPHKSKNERGVVVVTIGGLFMMIKQCSNVLVLDQKGHCSFQRQIGEENKMYMPLRFVKIYAHHNEFQQIDTYRQIMNVSEQKREHTGALFVQTNIITTKVRQGREKRKVTLINMKMCLDKLLFFPILL